MRACSKTRVGSWWMTAVLSAFVVLLGVGPAAARQATGPQPTAAATATSNALPYPSFGLGIRNYTSIRWPDIAFDSVNNVYLAVTGECVIQGVFITPAGVVGTPFPISNAALCNGSGLSNAMTPRVAFSRDSMQFLVTYHQGRGVAPAIADVWGTMVSYTPTGSVVGTPFKISSFTDGNYWEVAAAVAYSTGSPSGKQEFLVTWQGGYPSQNNIRIRRVSSTGVPLDTSEVEVTSGPGWESDPGVGYSPGSDTFVVAWLGYVDPSSYLYARAFQAGGLTPLGISPVLLDSSANIHVPAVVDVRAANRFFVTWYRSTGASQATYGRFLNGDASLPQGGTVVPISSWAAYDTNSVAYNPVSETMFFMTHGATEDVGLEIQSDGTPDVTVMKVSTLADPKGAFNPKLAANANQKQWMFVTSAGFASAAGGFILTTSGPVITAPTITSHPTSVLGQYVGLPVAFTAAAIGSPKPTVTWQVSTDSGSTWTAIAGATSTSYSFTMAAGDNNKQFRAVFTNAGGSATTNPAILTAGSGSVSIAPLALNIAATKSGAGGAILHQTPSQEITIQVNGGALSWTASTTAPWLQLTNTSGSSSGKVVVDLINPGNVVAGSTSLSAAITIKIGTATVMVPVGLTIYSASPPFGSFDTPVNGATGLTGSFAITGWALDDIGVDRVEIWRDLMAGEPADHAYTTDPSHPGFGKVFIANAFFVAGSRPDVEAAFPTTPLSYRSGWGYLLLSWGLWNQGNGTYTLHAFAYDGEGYSANMGSKTMTVDNAHATKPFGALDTPGYGATATGQFWNFGWALTPNNGSCNVAGGKIQVSVDSGPLLPVSYGAGRSDIAAAFPTFADAQTAGGAFFLDSTTLTNGLHAIGWLVTDGCGRQDGIGSRFFTVFNTGSATAPLAAAPRMAAAAITGGPISWDAVGVRRTDGSLAWVAANQDGVRIISVDQGERVEMQLPAIKGGAYSAYQLVNGTTRDLPIGSTFDPTTSVFSWQPGAPFLGSYELVFVAGDGTTVRTRFVVGPTMRSVIDTPQQGSTTSGSFTVAGWSLDLAGARGSGVDTVHVWAYPVQGGSPIFLGIAAIGGSRSDVAATYGAQFGTSGFDLTVDGLSAGTFDVVVFPHRAATQSFEGAVVVRVTVR